MLEHWPQYLVILLYAVNVTAGFKGGFPSFFIHIVLTGFGAWVLYMGGFWNVILQ